MKDATPYTTDGSGALPLVSIVIPVYRGYPYLAEAIDTALAQSWPEIEVIVVDDGSDDDGATRDIIRRYGNRIRSIEKENGGVATALNTAIGEMKGEFFSWLSHDDRYHPHKIARQMEVMQRQDGPAIVFGDFDVIDENGNCSHRREIGEGFDPEKPLDAVLEGQLNGCTMLIPRLCFDRCGMFSEGLPTTQDYDLWFRMAREFPFVHAPGALVQYRIHNAQGSRSPRHSEEASLLWISIIDRLSAAERTAVAGSDTKFLIRVLRKMRKAGFDGVVANLERRLAARMATQRATLIWIEDAADHEDDMTSAIARIEKAGPVVGEVLILETGNPRAATHLNSIQRGNLAMRCFRTRPDGVADAVCQAADIASSPMAIVADRRTKLASTGLRRALEQQLMEESDVVLQAEQDHRPGRGAVRSALPKALCGAVISTRAVRRRIAENAPVAQCLPQLLARLQVTVAQPIATSAEPPKQSAPPRPTGQLSQPRSPDRPTLLVISNDLGGDAARHAELVGRAASRTCNLLFAKGSRNRIIHVSSVSPDVPEVSFELPEKLPDFFTLLGDWAVARVDIVHTRGLEDHLPTILDRLGVPFDLTLVDCHTLASSLQVRDGAGAGGETPAFPSPLLVRADRRIAVSRDAARRCAELAPDLPFIPARIPEPFNPRGFDLHPAPLDHDEKMRVLLFGPLVADSGSELVREVVRRCHRDGAPIVFDLLGCTGGPVPSVTEQANMRLHGPFDIADLNRIVCTLRPHLAWLPFVVPPTHSFTASQAMLQGLPILASGIGALPERLEGRASTWLVDPAGDADRHYDWLRRLQEQRLSTPPHWMPTDQLPPLRDRFYENEYLAPLLMTAAQDENPEKASDPETRLAQSLQSGTR